MEFYMTDSQIMDNWKNRSETATKQLQILADLNVTSKEEMRLKLLNLGFTDVPKKRGGYKKKKEIECQSKEGPGEAEAAKTDLPIPCIIPDENANATHEPMTVKTLMSILETVSLDATVCIGGGVNVSRVSIDVCYLPSGKSSEAVVNIW